MSGHFASTKASFETAQTKVLAQQEKHLSLLQTFEADLERLRDVPLHPSLVGALSAGLGARLGLGDSGSVSTGYGTNTNTSLAIRSLFGTESPRLAAGAGVDDTAGSSGSGLTGLGSSVGATGTGTGTGTNIGIGALSLSDTATYSSTGGDGERERTGAQGQPPAAILTLQNCLPVDKERYEKYTPHLLN